MGASSLTFGALNRIIYADAAIEDFPNGIYLLAEVVKEISTQTGSRYRLRVADGQYSSTGVMTSTDGSVAVKENSLQASDIIKVTRFTCNFVQERKVLIIVDFEIAEKGNGAEIGKSFYPNFPTKDAAINKSPADSPQALPQPAAAHAPYQPPPQPSASAHYQPPIQTAPAPTQNSYPSPSYKRNGPTETPDQQMVDANGGAPPNKRPAPNYAAAAGINIVPITSLNPYNNNISCLIPPLPVLATPIHHKRPFVNYCIHQQNDKQSQHKWKIRAKVMHKSDLRQWSNARGEGCLFSMDLADETGEIRATAFKQEAEKFHKLIVEGGVYEISNGQLKAANKKFTSLKNDYELAFTSSTVVKASEASAVKVETQFDFVPIATLPDRKKDDIVDVIGIVQDFGDLVRLTSRSGKNFIKRDLAIIDETKNSVQLTLWANQAENLDTSHDKVCIAVKGCRVGEWNGCSLSAVSGSRIEINPNISACHRLMVWWEDNKDSAVTQIKNLSIGQSGQSNGPTTVIGITEANNVAMNGDVPVYFSVRGTITVFGHQDSFYKACITEGCNKKLISQPDGTYRCEKCQQIHNEFSYRLILNVEICDPTGSHWASVFNDAGEAMFGRKSSELGALQDDPEKADEFNEFFSDVLFRTFTFRIQAKRNTYNDETRVIWRVQSVKREAENDLDTSLAMLTAGIETLKTIESKKN